MAAGSAFLFPITLLANVYPWGIELAGVPLWWVAVGAFVAYPIGTFVGGLDPLD